MFIQNRAVLESPGCMTIEFPGSPSPGLPGFRVPGIPVDLSIIWDGKREKGYEKLEMRDWRWEIGDEIREMIEERREIGGRGR
jgi:hypothetical protein